MKKLFYSFTCILTFALMTICCGTAQSSLPKISSLGTKANNLATLTENVLAITGTSTGNSAVDGFLNSTSSLLQRYKTVNNTLKAINVIKDGSGISSITNNGSTISRLAAISELTGISSQLSSIGKESTNTVKTGTDLLQSLMKSKTTTATSSNIQKINTAMSALSLLGVEVPQSFSTATSLLGLLK